MVEPCSGSGVVAQVRGSAGVRAWGSKLGEGRQSGILASGILADAERQACGRPPDGSGILAGYR